MEQAQKLIIEPHKDLDTIGLLVIVIDAVDEMVIRPVIVWERKTSERRTACT